DHGEKVIEVVRDAARKPSNRFEFLRLEEALFALPERSLGPLDLGYVKGEPDLLVRVIVAPRRAGEHGDARPVFANVLLLERRAHASRLGLEKGARVVVEVLHRR